MTDDEIDKAKHTPGPWFYEGGEVRATCRHGVVWAVAKVGRVLESDEQHDANARLIATAPDLLETLENILKEYQNDGTGRTLKEDCDAIDEAYSRAEEAIAKAKGGSDA